MSTPEQRYEWRKLQGEGMRSAIGEYTPGEFWEILEELDTVEERLREIGKALGMDDWEYPGQLIRECERLREFEERQLDLAADAKFESFRD